MRSLRCGSTLNRSVLYQEAELMIKEELATDAAIYLWVIAAVAGGPSA